MHTLTLLLLAALAGRWMARKLAAWDAQDTDRLIAEADRLRYERARAEALDAEALTQEQERSAQACRARMPTPLTVGVWISRGGEVVVAWNIPADNPDAIIAALDGITKEERRAA